MRQRHFLPIATFLLIALTAGSAAATRVGYGKNFGIGAMVGEPTGLTLKFFVGQANAVDIGLGFWGYGYRGDCSYYENGRWYECRGYDNRYFSTHVDYLWQSNIVKSKVQLDWHVGVGGRVWFWNRYRYHEDAGDLDLAVRAPIGLDLMFQNPDFLEVFFEVAPQIELLYGPDFWIDWNLGARFYF